MKLNIQNLRKNDAYKRLLNWYLQNYRHGTEWLWENALPKWVLWMIGKGFKGCPEERLAKCARREPFPALLWAAKFLPQDVLIECARKEPWVVLLHGAELLPQDVLIECVRKVPKTALKYVEDLLPSAVVDSLVDGRHDHPTAAAVDQERGEDKTTTKTQYPVEIIETDEGFFASVPDLDGCMTQGDTIEEVWGNVQEAITLWIETARENGLPIPPPSRRLIVETTESPILQTHRKE